MKSRFAPWLMIAVIAVVAAGCGTPNRYRIMERQAAHEPVPMRVVVTDMDDERGRTQFVNSAWTLVPIIGLWGGYVYDRHDSVHSAVLTPFPQWYQQQLAGRLSEADVFESVEYHPRDELPELGEYDLLVQGRMNELAARGAISRFGLSIFGDLLWEIGVPYLTRRWTIDVDYQIVDGVTGEVVLPHTKAELTTGRSLFTRFYRRAQVADLERKMTPVLDAFIDTVWTELPSANDSYWAELREQAEQRVAEIRREEELARRGTPPTFSFLNPSEGAQLRAPRATVRWAISAPQGLRNAGLTVNNRQVDLPLDTLSMIDPDTAPTSVPAQDLEVPLDLGENRIEALVVDHRANQTRAGLTLVRLPAALSPPNRHALLIGGSDSPAVQNGLAALAEVLEDPMLGQFGENVTGVRAETLSREVLEESVREFGTRPLSGELVFVYITGNGDWEDLSLGDGSITMDEFVALLGTSLATGEVVLLADIGWEGTDGTGPDIASRLEALPVRWAFVPSKAEGGELQVEEGMPLFATAVVDTFRGEDGDTSRMNLERFLDVVAGNALQTGALSPDIYGRFNPSHTMVERE